ncbi:MAG TPA: hypothetical protein VF974_01085 [Patescibacteria group bacterium]
MKIQYKLFLVCALGLLIMFVPGQHKVFAADNNNDIEKKITFPVQELGGCTSKQACRTYCEDVAHIDACLTFAEKQGLMSGEEIAQARTFAKKFKGNLVLPGGTKTPGEAKKYCQNPDHADECLTFAQKNGFIKSDEAKNIKKFLDLQKSGLTPGGCKDKDSCEKFCQADANRDICLKFAEDNGLMSADESRMAHEFKDLGGPGGCKTKDVCEKFCNDPANQQTCLKFAEEHGFIKKEDSQKIKDGMGRLRSTIGEHPEFQTCLLKSLDQATLDKIQQNQLVPTQSVAGVIKACGDKFKDEIKLQNKNTLDGSPPELKDCLQAQVGNQNLDAMKKGGVLDPAIADKARSCFSQFGNKDDGHRNQGEHHDGQPTPRPGITGLPEDLKKCILAKTGKTDLTGMSMEDLKAAVMLCAKEIPNTKSKGENFNQNMSDPKFHKFEDHSSDKAVPVSPQQTPNFRKLENHDHEMPNPGMTAPKPPMSMPMPMP